LSPLGIGNTPGLLSQNSHQAQNPSQLYQPPPQPPPPPPPSSSLHMAHHHQQGSQLNQNPQHYPDFYNSNNSSSTYNGQQIHNNNSMLANYNYSNQQNLSTKYQQPPLQVQTPQQSTAIVGINRPQSAIMPNEQYNLPNEIINSSDTFILDDVLDLNFAPNDPLTSTATTIGNNNNIASATSSSTVVEDDSFMNFSFAQNSNTTSTSTTTNTAPATNTNSSIHSQNMPPINATHPNQPYFQQQYQNQMLNNSNNLVNYQGPHHQRHAPPLTSLSQQPQQMYYNQTPPIQSSPMYQHQQINPNFQNMSINNNNNNNIYNNNNNSSFDLIAEDSKGGLLQQLLLD
jgi:hypothetical protein